MSHEDGASHDGTHKLSEISRLRRPLLLLGSDILATMGTALLVGGGRALFFPEETQMHLLLLPLLILAPLFYYFDGLYDPVLPPFPQELRKLGVGITFAYLGLSIVLFLTRSELPSRMVIVVSWLLALGVTPYLRVLVRKRFASRPWWGRAVVIFGSPDGAVSLTRFLRFAPETGLRPEALVCEGAPLLTSGPDAFIAATLPVLKTTAEVERFAALHPEAYAVILGDSFEACAIRELMEQIGRLFPSVFLMVGYMGNEMPMWLRPVEIAHTMTLQMRQNLFDPRRRAFKRVLDLIAASAGTLVLSPFLIGIAVWIRLESPGPIFFTQRRVGLNGEPFRVLKFRTMVSNAEQVLETYLEKDPELRKEWEADHKLRHDPRITRAGQFLRRTSLDEIPQIWNVFKGEMSLIGPRPIVDEEISKYGQAFAAYVRVRPGMTGLWQVSGRNDTSYAYRVSIDSYYICNWSIWMDIWILARTPQVVFKGSGAY